MRLWTKEKLYALGTEKKGNLQGRCDKCHAIAESRDEVPQGGLISSGFGAETGWAASRMCACTRMKSDSGMRNYEDEA